MQNPFESGHIKNYILLYVSVVVIMVLFFFATMLWHEPHAYAQKKFEASVQKVEEAKVAHEAKEHNESTKFRLLER